MMPGPGNYAILEVSNNQDNFTHNFEIKNIKAWIHDIFFQLILMIFKLFNTIHLQPKHNYGPEGMEYLPFLFTP